MAQSFAFELVSPERLLVSGEAEEVSVPGSDGMFTVMANHSPLMSTIRPGILSVKSAAGEQKFVVLGGFADVSQAGCTILAERATPVGEVDVADIDARIEDARSAAASATGDEDMAAAASHLDSLLSLRAAL